MLYIHKVGDEVKLINPELSFLSEVMLELKVSKFQNEFMKSSFLPKYERKIVRISALCSEGRNLGNYFGRSDGFINSF